MKYKWSLLLPFFLLTHIAADAQVWKNYSSFYPRIGLQLGTQGIGLEGAYPLSRDFNIRVGAHIFPSSKTKWNDHIYDLRRSSVNLLLDWQPLYGKESWFARKWIVSAGAGYFFKNTLERFEGSSIADEQAKDYTIDYSKFRPYLGTGLNGIRLSYRLDLAVQVGYFIPTSSSTLTLYEMDPVELPALQERLDSFPEKQLPGVNVQVGISYVLFKSKK